MNGNRNKNTETVFGVKVQAAARLLREQHYYIKELEGLRQAEGEENRNGPQSTKHDREQTVETDLALESTKKSLRKYIEEIRQMRHENENLCIANAEVEQVVNGTDYLQ